MKMTLLEMTQTLLSALNSDEVNSIGDTAESKQVAECIRTSYLNMQGRYDLPEHNQLFQLTPSNDPTQPVLMYRPDGVNRIEWIKYYNTGSPTTQESTEFEHDLNVDIVDTSDTTGGDAPITPGFGMLRILTPEQFVDYTNAFNPEESDVFSFALKVNINSSDEPNIFHLRYKNSKPPQYYTIIQNYYIIFDSFDVTADTTLQAANTLAFGWVIPKFKMEDKFIPNLDEAQVPLLLNEAKSLAFLELKNMPHQKAEQEVLRQLSSLSKFKALAHRPTPFEQLAYYGRR